VTPRTNFKETEIGKIPEDWEDGAIFVATIRFFLEKEKFILTKHLNERTITHKLAEYLKIAFNGYDVDCEYNRMQSQKINEEYITKRLNFRIEELRSDNEQGSPVFPDIIVHKRGVDTDNYIIIEVKKKEFAFQTNKDGVTYREMDFRKLKAYVSQLGYEYGIYLEFDQNKVSELAFLNHKQGPWTRRKLGYTEK
jgi:hypothetical protein